MISTEKRKIEYRDGFYISFNPETDTGPETAIAIQRNHKIVGVHSDHVTNMRYKILKGDHRAGYGDKNLEECLKYFELNKDQISPWSD